MFGKAQAHASLKITWQIMSWLLSLSENYLETLFISKVAVVKVLSTNEWRMERSD